MVSASVGRTAGGRTSRLAARRRRRRWRLIGAALLGAGLALLLAAGYDLWGTGLRTAGGRFVYRVLWTGVGPADSGWVLFPTADPSLTLTTCNPRFSAGQRLVVRAIQVSGPAPGGFLDHLHDPLGSWLVPPVDRA